MYVLNSKFSKYNSGLTYCFFMLFTPFLKTSL